MSIKPSSIELDKNDGITILLTNGGTEQTVTINGTAITLEIKVGGVMRSSIVQTAEGVTIECDTFVVNAKKASSFTTGSFTVAAAEAAAVMAPEVNVLAEGDLNLAGAAISAEAADFALEAAAVEVTAATIALTGITNCEILNISGAGMIDGVPIV